MPLSERVRIEVYLPDLPKSSYNDLLDAFDRDLRIRSVDAQLFEGLTAVIYLKPVIRCRTGSMSSTPISLSA